MLIAIDGEFALLPHSWLSWRIWIYMDIYIYMIYMVDLLMWVINKLLELEGHHFVHNNWTSLDEFYTYIRINTRQPKNRRGN